MNALLRKTIAAWEALATRLALPAPSAAGAGPFTRWGFWVGLALVLLVGAWMRAHWVIGVELDPALTWNGYPVLTSTDGYYFAAGVKHALSDVLGAWPRVPYAADHGLVALAAGAVHLTGAAPEAVFTWAPVVLGPLVALPIALLGRYLGGPVMGLVAGLGAVVAPAHVLRTTAGYFDTDLFSVTLPLFALFSLARLLRSDAATREPPRDALWAGLVLALYPFFYDQGDGVALVMTLAASALIALRPRLLRLRGEARDLPWAPFAVTTLALANLPVPVWARVGLVLVSHLALWRLPFTRVAAVAIATLGCLAATATGDTAHSLYIKIKVYGGAEAPTEGTPGLGAEAGPAATGTDWKRQDTTGLVAEARVLTLEPMLEKASGHPLVFALGALGLLGLLLWRPSLGVMAPLVGVGLFAFIGGHRFLIYLAPLLALGLAWLVARLAALLPRARSAATALGACLFVPAAGFDLGGHPTTALVRGEVEALEQLGARARPTDTTVAWWDFGYPIVYHAHTRTITDGSRRGDDAALAAEVLLTDSPELAQRLALLSADALAHDPERGAAASLLSSAREAGLGPAAWLDRVRAGAPSPYAPSGEVYLYLPLRMLTFAPALEAYRPSSAGVVRKPPYLRVYRGVRSEGPRLLLADGVEVDAESVTMRRQNPRTGAVEKKALREIHVVGGSGATLKKRSRPGQADAPTAGVFLPEVGVFVELEPRLLASQWAQLFFFEQADPRRFELVHGSPVAKVWRVLR